MCDAIKKIKSDIRLAEKARQDLMKRIDNMQTELSEKFVKALKQYPTKYDSEKRVDAQMLASSQQIDELEIEYLRLEQQLKDMQEQMFALMEAEK